MRLTVITSLVVLALSPALIADTQQQTFTNMAKLDTVANLNSATATIDNPGQARLLVGQLAPSALTDTAKDPEAYCIIHILLWGPPDTNNKQAIQAQNWYLFSTRNGWSQEAFTQNKRLFGTHRLYLLYIHLNRQPAAQEADYTPSYTVTVTKTIPTNLQHLLTIFNAFTGGMSGLSGAAPAAAAPVTNYYGGGVLDLQYIPSSINISSTFVEKSSPSSPPATLSGPVTFLNENGYFFDFGFSVPVTSINQVTINYTAGTAMPSNTNDYYAFAVIDGYFTREDVSSSNWTRFPHPLAGVGVASQPLHKILVAGAWGPRFAELYLGAMFVKQPKRSAGSSCSSGNTASVVSGQYQYCSQFAVGINFPVSAIASTVKKSQ